MDGPRATHFTRLRILAIAGVLFSAFLAYRVFFVYTVRSGDCTADASVPYRPVEGPATLDRELVVMTYNAEGHAALLDAEHLAEVAAVIGFLVESAASYVTGAVWTVDGGRTILSGADAARVAPPD